MHQLAVEHWSRGRSHLHARDPRAKIVVLLVFLVVVATARHGLFLLLPALLLLLAAALLWARLPLAGALARAAVVLPFAGMFALLSWLAGEPRLGVVLVTKSYLSALAVLLVMATTGLPALLNGLAVTGLPRFLLVIAQFLYRYLFVISEEAQHMNKAAAARGGGVRSWMASGLRFRAAGGALAVLFARSYARAEGIHQSMLARGFRGRLPSLEAPHFSAADAWFTGLAALAPVLLRLAIERAVP